MTSGHDVSEYLDTLGLVQSYFFKFFEKKNKNKNREKKYLGAPTPPEDQAIFLFAELLANPDMPLSQEGCGLEGGLSSQGVRGVMELLN